MLIILSQNNIVNCSMTDYFITKFSQFSSYVSDTFKNVGENIKYFFNPSSKPVLQQIQPNKDDELDALFIDRPLNRELKVLFHDLARTDYEVRKVGPNARDDGAELLLATPQLALWHGRDMDSHIVQTVDGYFLTVHRITANPYLQANRTVLLHHGFLGSSTDWILLGPSKSLPYILSDAGFDVWLTNARGNYYSRGHLSRDIECADYWKFSWEEMGERDLPAVIDYIRQTKNLTESINFVGHSMGTTALLVLLSSMPKYNNYLRVGVLLAPLAYMSNVKGPMKTMTGISEEIIKGLGEGEFLANRKVPSWLATNYCKGPKIFCRNPLLFLSGHHQDWRWSASFVAKLLYHVPAGASTNTVLHYMQVARNRKFHRFNHPEKEISLVNITLPIALISSSDDWLATIPDVLKLYFDLVNPIDHYIIRNMSVTHTGFVWGYDANILVFDKVVEYLEKGLIWNMQKENEI